MQLSWDTQKAAFFTALHAPLCCPWSSCQHVLATPGSTLDPSPRRDRPRLGWAGAAASKTPHQTPPNGACLVVFQRPTLRFGFRACRVVGSCMFDVSLPTISQLPSSSTPNVATSNQLPFHVSYTGVRSPPTPPGGDAPDSFGRYRDWPDVHHASTTDPQGGRPLSPLARHPIIRVMPRRPSVPPRVSSLR